VDNQSQIAKRLVGRLDHDDAGVVQRAAHDLQALAKDHPGAPVVIVNAGAIMPLVTVLSNGKTDEGRTAAAKTLHVLANSGPARDRYRSGGASRCRHRPGAGVRDRLAPHPLDG